MGELEIIIPIWDRLGSVVVTKENLPIQIKKIFYEKMKNYKIAVFYSSIPGRYQWAKKLEMGRRFEEAAQVYETLGLWYMAGQVRRKIFYNNFENIKEVPVLN
jgi:hypothetical protein